jgi:chemotaxis protein MotB
VEPNLIERVTGYASTKPLPQEKPTAEANQRVTLSLALASKARFKDSSLVESPAAAPAAPASAPPPAGPGRGAAPNSSP